MVRRTDVRRDSKPIEGPLFSDEHEKAALEARNGLLQFDEVVRQADAAIRGSAFKLRPSLLQSLQRIAVQDIYSCAGSYRNGPVSISGTTHQPPPWQEVPQLVEDFCDYVNGNWTRSAVHLAAYAMWRVNWIHPFRGGNGRTSRAVSYLIMCVRGGAAFPGPDTVPEYIVANRQPYYAALDAADAAHERGIVDVSQMEALLSAALAAQLLSAHKGATTDG